MCKAGSPAALGSCLSIHFLICVSPPFDTVPSYSCHLLTYSAHFRFYSYAPLGLLLLLGVSEPSHITPEAEDLMLRFVLTTTCICGGSWEKRKGVVSFVQIYLLLHSYNQENTRTG